MMIMTSAEPIRGVGSAGRRSDRALNRFADVDRKIASIGQPACRGNNNPYLPAPFLVLNRTSPERAIEDQPTRGPLTAWTRALITT